MVVVSCGGSVWIGEGGSIEFQIGGFLVIIGFVFYRSGLSGSSLIRFGDFGVCSDINVELDTIWLAGPEISFFLALFLIDFIC